MPRASVQLGPNVFYGDVGPENPAEGSEWRQANGQAQFFVNGKWRSAPVGYVSGNGSGATVTQQTNRTTGVTINAVCGQIVTNNASLAAAAEATFTVTNSQVAATDVVAIACAGGQTAGTSVPIVTAVAAGSFDITLTNLHASTADTGAMTINFAVVKSATS